MLLPKLVAFIGGYILRLCLIHMRLQKVNCSYPDAILASSDTGQNTKMESCPDYDRSSVIRLHQIDPFRAGSFWVFAKLHGLEHKDTLDIRKEMRATAKESRVSK